MINGQLGYSQKSGKNTNQDIASLKLKKGTMKSNECQKLITQINMANVATSILSLKWPMVGIMYTMENVKQSIQSHGLSTEEY